MGQGTARTLTMEEILRSALTMRIHDQRIDAGLTSAQALEVIATALDTHDLESLDKNSPYFKEAIYDVATKQGWSHEATISFLEQVVLRYDCDADPNVVSQSDTEFLTLRYCTQCAESPEQALELFKEFPDLEDIGFISDALDLGSSPEDATAIARQTIGQCEADIEPERVGVDDIVVHNVNPLGDAYKAIYRQERGNGEDVYDAVYLTLMARANGPENYGAHRCLYLALLEKVESSTARTLFEQWQLFDVHQQYCKRPDGQHLSFGEIIELLTATIDQPQ